MDDNSQEFSLNAVYPNPSECESLMTDTSITLTAGYNLNVKLSKCNTLKKPSPNEDINLNNMGIVFGKYKNRCFSNMDSSYITIHMSAHMI